MSLGRRSFRIGQTSLQVRLATAVTTTRRVGGPIRALQLKSAGSHPNYAVDGVTDPSPPRAAIVVGYTVTLVFFTVFATFFPYWPFVGWEVKVRCNLFLSRNCATVWLTPYLHQSNCHLREIDISDFDLAIFPLQVMS